MKVGCWCLARPIDLYATNGKNAINSTGVSYTLIELDKCGEVRNGEVQQILAEITGRKTVPNAILAGRSIGGGNELCKLQSRGALKPMFEAAGCVFGK
eukprot:CAMPEP_0119304418 /NCGR_PEP_ID=MMETSP1333-20130426/5646_1 /TAXON_ID=418940 /ORGANISM="Scyphosphaera apsteinii, Strain RCC1455" /LENGTH=97 /DNA_ID=CAMNT_0007307297 /DNA_START=133 /DNA_END=425 /DNA_ORIENTATION=+